jgi:hypothetical protein
MLEPRVAVTVALETQTCTEGDFPLVGRVIGFG